MLSPNQKCLDNLSQKQSQSEFISKEKITIGDYEGVRVVEKAGAVGFPNNIIWYPNTYCISKGDKAFVMIFYETQQNSGKHK